jgi:DNA polymerase III epsilon subunit family exonuclease
MSPIPARTPIDPDAPLTDLEFVAFDTETTGCASATGRMVEIGAVRFRFDGTELDRFTRLIDPLRPIPRVVTRIHGITDAMVRGCPTEAAVLPDFVDFLGDPSRTVAMAHNAPFDLAFVGSAFSRAARPAPPHLVIDTVRLARRRAGGLPSHSLRSLVRCFGVGNTTEHRGLSDSIALKQVFLSLVAKPPALQTTESLFALAPPRRFRAEETSYRRRSEEPWEGRHRRSPLTRPTASGSNPIEAATASVATEPGLCGNDRILLGDAIARGRIVSLIYDGGSSAGERRSVTPLRFVVATEVTYLLAFCHADRKQKQYRLDRIRELVIE